MDDDLARLWTTASGIIHRRAYVPDRAGVAVLQCNQAKGLLLDEYKKAFDRIPWKSFGRATPLSQVARSLVAVGNHSNLSTPNNEHRYISSLDDGFEDWMMEIVGSAFQAGPGKLLTCWHVCDGLRVRERQAYVQARLLRDGDLVISHFPISAVMSFVDPRIDAGNRDIDIGLAICPAIDTPEYPYRVPNIQWGDSTEVGVGDRVILGGFPLGTNLFRATDTNRAIMQPSFFEGIISAILPASSIRETRLFQISSIALGGMSGGVVCRPDTAEVIGMVTSGLSGQEGFDYPITYAIPSEVLRPFAEAVNFEAGGRRWR